MSDPVKGQVGDYVSKKSKILIITLEPIGKKMAGPAIRALEIGKRLCRDFEVTVASTVKVEDGIDKSSLPPNLKLVEGAGKKMISRLALIHSAIFIQANVLKPFPFLGNMYKHLIVYL